MLKYHVLRKRIEYFETTVEANDTDEVYDVIADGIDWDFLESDDEFEIEEVK